MTTVRFLRKPLVQLASAALLALFAAACQPAGQPAAETSPSAAPTGVQRAANAPMAACPTGTPTPHRSEADLPPGPATQLTAFLTGDLAEADTNQNLDLPDTPFFAADCTVHTFEEFRGKVVVFNMWGSWCAPCMEEMPTLAALQDAFPNKDVVVIPIAVGEDDPDPAYKKLAQLAGGRLPYFYEPTWGIQADVRSQAYPTTIIYGRDGREAVRLISPAKWDSETSIAMIRAVLEGKS